MFFSQIISKTSLMRIVMLSFALTISSSFAAEVPIDDFSIAAYPQDISQYLSADSADYSTPLLTSEYQAAQLKQFYNHYYASDTQGLSPWSEQMVKSLLPSVKRIELEILDEFDNQSKADGGRHYAENFKEHNENWLNSIKKNIDLAALNSIAYREENKAIAITNTFARALPDGAPDFFHFSLPGQGFPFDNLQESVIWSATPLYVFAVSQDKAWSLVLTPDAYFAWVKSSDIAYASSDFITQWQAAAQKNLVAITQTDTSIVNKQQHFQFTGYIGAVFPFSQQNGNVISILLAKKNDANQAIIDTGLVNQNNASKMPLTATRQHIANIIQQLQNRPYGWGGAFYFNDCSQEIKSIFAPFGLWLPRNSAQQAKLNPALDLANKSVDERLKLLKTKGHPLMTVIYIGGHVMLYVGTKDNDNHEQQVITYQNIWGLSPATKDKRYVIGQSLFFPLLKYYPENPDVSSLANKAAFKLVYLDQLNNNHASPQSFAKTFVKIAPPADL